MNVMQWSTMTGSFHHFDGNSTCNVIRCAMYPLMKIHSSSIKWTNSTSVVTVVMVMVFTTTVMVTPGFTMFTGVWLTRVFVGLSVVGMQVSVPLIKWFKLLHQVFPEENFSISGEVTHQVKHGSVFRELNFHQVIMMFLQNYVCKHVIKLFSVWEDTSICIRNEGSYNHFYPYESRFPRWRQGTNTFGFKILPSGVNVT